MSLFSKIGDFFKKLFDKIAGILKKVMSALRDVMPFLIIAAVIFFPAIAPAIASYLPATLGAQVLSAGLWVESLTMAELWGLALGTALVLDPGGTVEVASKTIEAAGDIASEVVVTSADVVSDGVGAIASNLFSSSYLWWGLAGVAAYLILSSDSTTDTSPERSGGKNVQNLTY